MGRGGGREVPPEVEGAQEGLSKARFRSFWAVVWTNWRSRGEAGGQEGPETGVRSDWCLKVTESLPPGLP